MWKIKRNRYTRVLMRYKIILVINYYCNTVRPVFTLYVVAAHLGNSTCGMVERLKRLRFFLPAYFYLLLAAI